MLFTTLAVSVAFQAAAQLPPSYTVTTFAGTGEAGFDGATGTASTAKFNNPYSIYVDKSGVIWVADQANSRIRRIGTDKAVTLVAGVGTNGPAGDDAAATAAQLYYPCGLVVDSSGNVFIADTNNDKIRKVVPGGNITTYAGNGIAGYTEQATDNKDPKSVQFNKPVSVAFDSAGALLVVDSFNHRIRKITSDGVVSVVAGSGTEGYSGDGGPALSANLANPQAIAWDAVGNLYIADTGNNVIRKVNKDGVITTIAGTGAAGFSGDGGPAAGAMLYTPKGMAFDSAGNLFFADSFNGRIRVIKTDGTIATIAGNGGFGDDSNGTPAYAARFRFPSWVAIAPDGGIYVVDNQNHKIKLLSPSQDPVLPVETPSINSGQVAAAAAYGASQNIAPGSWIELFGINYALKARSWTSGDFNGTLAPITLDGTWVRIGGLNAYISYISPTQINAQVPSGVPAGPQTVVVGTPAGVSRPYTVNVKTVQPGLWAPPVFNINGKQYLGALLPDGQYALPPNAVAGISSRPAKPGEVVVTYGTGFGSVTPAFNAGQIVDQPNSLDLPLVVKIGDAAAAAPYAGLAVNYVGLYQFNITVPAGVSGDAVPVTFTLGGAPGSQTLYIAVQP
ncbi:MAG: hypothetical protein IT161_02550 [Bryobacterales bacterium]|nr:hypothetical protein [Bryobacterales bacterium]